MTLARRKPQAKRRGSILVCVIVALSVSTTLIAAMTRSALQNRQQIRAERQLRQVKLLVEAGAQRAVAKLQQDDTYTGEEWRLDSEALPGFDGAVVEIEVDSAEAESSRMIQVSAVLAQDSLRPVRRSDAFSYKSPRLTSSSTAPSNSLNKEPTDALP